MCLKKYWVNILTGLFLFSSYGLFTNQVHAQESTPAPTLTEEEQSQAKSESMPVHSYNLTPIYLLVTPVPTVTNINERDKSLDDDTPESVLSEEMEQEDKDIKNNKVPFRPWHSKYGPGVPLPPQPNSPTNFKALPGDGMAYLSWDAMPRAIGYVLFVSEDGKNFRRRLRKPFQKNQITIGVLKNEKTYYFAVSSVGPAGIKSRMVIQSVVPKKTVVP